MQKHMAASVNSPAARAAARRSAARASRRPHAGGAAGKSRTAVSSGPGHWTAAHPAASPATAPPPPGTGSCPAPAASPGRHLHLCLNIHVTSALHAETPPYDWPQPVLTPQCCLPACIDETAVKAEITENERPLASGVLRTLKARCSPGPKHRLRIAAGPAASQLSCTSFMGSSKRSASDLRLLRHTASPSALCGWDVLEAALDGGRPTGTPPFTCASGHQARCAT